MQRRLLCENPEGPSLFVTTHYQIAVFPLPANNLIKNTSKIWNSQIFFIYLQRQIRNDMVNKSNSKTNIQ